MNELEQKLSKRRTVVEESGLKFESQPSAHESVMATPASPYRTCAAPPKHNGGVDFQSAITRRRATVDGDGETFESTPSQKTADAIASPQNVMRPAGYVPKNGSADFKQVIDQQRATVDGGAKTFESLPAERTADCVNSLRSETMQLPMPMAGEQHQEDATQDFEEEDCDEDGTSPVREDHDLQVDKTTLTVKGHRVAWLIGLSHPLADEFESDGFAVDECEPVKLKLQCLESGCRLSVHAPDGVSEELQVKLFVGKGWKKKAFRTWNASSSLEEDFDTDLTHRNSILCGVIFKEKEARQV